MRRADDNSARTGCSAHRAAADQQATGGSESAISQQFDLKSNHPQ
jgi:hypothetical protein